MRRKRAIARKDVPEHRTYSGCRLQETPPNPYTRKSWCPQASLREPLLMPPHPLKEGDDFDWVPGPVTRAPGRPCATPSQAVRRCFMAHPHVAWHLRETPHVRAVLRTPPFPRPSDASRPHVDAPSLRNRESTRAAQHVVDLTAAYDRAREPSPDTRRARSRALGGRLLRSAQAGCTQRSLRGPPAGTRRGQRVRR
jgi:hypothetical protein